VFGQANAWVFGRSGAGGQGFAFRFNGQSWRRVAIPVRPTAVAAPQPGNIWVAGPAQPGSFGRKLAHWTGSGWRTVAFPDLGAPSSAVFARSIVWDSARGAWISGNLAPSGSAPTGMLLHWTGKVWVDVSPPFQANDFRPLSHDGEGGLWMTLADNCGGRCQYEDMANLDSSGTWTESSIAAQYVDVLAMRLIPGTASVWAGGVAGQGSDNAVILKFGF